jgi:hypothetical protein
MIRGGTFVPGGTWNQSGKGECFMHAAIERIMQTYGMIKTLSQAEETEIRGKVSTFLEGQRHIGDDEQKLTISGLRFLHNL